MKIKLESSPHLYPTNKEYVEDVFKRQGIQLDLEKIEPNPVRRKNQRHSSLPQGGRSSESRRYMTAQHTTELLKQAGTGVSAASFQSNIASFTFRPEMASDIIALVSSYHTPGHIIFNIDFTEIPEESLDLRLFIALLCKLVFFRSVINPMNNITDESAREIEKIILDGLMSMRLVEALPGAPIQAYSLSRVRVPLARVREFTQGNLESLQTDFMGGGWANSGAPLPGNDPLGMVYPGCPPRPRFVTEFDDFELYKDDEVFSLQRWDVATASESILNCFRQAYKG
ncbi:hypothetical protein U1Q18_044663 [Sarracenia purpurea var. burkii]